MNSSNYNNYYIELVENIPCNNINEVRKLEGEYIKKKLIKNYDNAMKYKFKAKF